MKLYIIKLLPNTPNVYYSMLDLKWVKQALSQRHSDSPGTCVLVIYSIGDQSCQVFFF